MFANRHVIIALLVAPVLAVLAWFAVGKFVGEHAAPAQSGRSYPLLARSNCRYASGQCDLENQDMKLSLSYHVSLGGVLELRASHALESAHLAISDAATDPAPQLMQPLGPERRRWQLRLPVSPGANDTIRLVAVAEGARYFVAAPTVFLQPGS